MEMSLDRAMIGELERAGSEPSAISLRSASEAAWPAKRSKVPGSLGQKVLVLQGGGALGAYQAGVYQALHEAGIEPDWVVGTSIGAINASLIAGNEPADRLERLRNSGAAWSTVRCSPAWRMPVFGR